MNVLMSISAIGAAVLGEWGEGAAVVVLFALGGALQARTLERTRGAIRGLMALSPATASRVDAAGVESSVLVEALAIGDLVRVRPGERVPADGVVVEGISAVDQSPITGESMPADKARGRRLFRGHGQWTRRAAAAGFTGSCRFDAGPRDPSGRGGAGEQSPSATDGRSLRRGLYPGSDRRCGATGCRRIARDGRPTDLDLPRPDAPGDRLPLRAGDLDPGLDRLRDWRRRPGAAS